MERRAFVSEKGQTPRAARSRGGPGCSTEDSVGTQVTERHRSRLVRQGAPPDIRAFGDMQEITHMIAHGGHRGNRGDMTQVRDFLERRGLGDAFGIVLGNGAFA